MASQWDSNLKNEIQKFLYSTRYTNKNHFYPVNKGRTNNGQNLRLGFSCYAIKCFYMLDLWDDLSDSEKIKWVNYIIHFKQIKNLPNNSMLIQWFLVLYFFLRIISIKNNLKLGVNKF